MRAFFKVRVLLKKLTHGGFCDIFAKPRQNQNNRRCAMPRITAFILIGAWLAFAALAPRLLSGDIVGLLAIAGMAVTVAVLAVSGHVSRPDPLSLNLTGRRPYWDMR
jgi:hypothetical protein